MNQWMEEDELIALVDEIPAGRLGKAEEVADLAYHLGYKESYLTGQIIGLEGGGSKTFSHPLPAQQEVFLQHNKNGTGSLYRFLFHLSCILCFKNDYRIGTVNKSYRQFSISRHI